MAAYKKIKVYHHRHKDFILYAKSIYTYLKLLLYLED